MDRVKEFIIPEEISELLENTAIKTNRSELFHVVEVLKIISAKIMIIRLQEIDLKIQPNK